MNAVGNIANQKYEAARNIERHLTIINHTLPSQETSRWRTYEPAYNFTKQKGRLVEEERRVNKDNQYLSERLLEIVTEDRKSGTHEYAPGWRVGPVGTCIDCYPSTTHELVSRNKSKTFAQLRQFNQGKIDNLNLHTYEFISKARSSYQHKDHEKAYERNREVFKIFSHKTPVTTLHLGLVKLAKQNISRRNQMAVAHNTAIDAKSPSNRGNKHNSRPSTAGAGQVSKTTANKKLEKALDSMHSISDVFNSHELMREVANRNYGDWDRTTNDNLYTSEHNNLGRENKAFSIYTDEIKTRAQSARASTRNYLNDRCTDILTRAKDFAQTQEEHNKNLRNLSGRLPYRSTLTTQELHSPQFSSPNSGNNSGNEQNKESKLSFDLSRPDSPNKGRSTSMLDTTPLNRFKKLNSMRRNVSFDESGVIASTYRAATSPTAAVTSPSRRRGSVSTSSINSVGGNSTIRKALQAAVNAAEDGVSFSSIPFNGGDRDTADEEKMHPLHIDELAETVTTVTIPDVDEEELLHKLRPTDEFIIDQHLELTSQFHFFVRKDCMEDPRMVQCVSIICLDKHGHDVGRVITANVGIVIYDVGYVLTGNEEMANRHFGAKHQALERKGSMSSRHHLETAVLAGGESNRHLQTFTQSSPQARSHRLTLPTTVGVLVAVYVISTTDEEEVIPVGANGFQYLTMNQLLYTHRIPRDSAILTVLHEMQSFSYPYQGQMSKQQARRTDSARRKSFDHTIAHQHKVTIDEHLKQAMVYPCLLDMCDEEEVMTLSDPVVETMHLQWAEATKSLQVKCL